MLKIGIVGCGFAAEKLHLPVLKNFGKASIVAAADIDETRLTQISDRFRIPRRYTDALRLLGDPEVRAVLVCVPTQFHAEIGLAALDAGKHLLIEKPLALSLPECDQLIEQAARSHRRTMVGFNMRWHRVVRQARTMIGQGLLGDIHLMRTTLTAGFPESQMRQWRARRETGGGTLFEVAIHHFDLARFLLRDDFVEVYAESVSGKIDDQVAAIAGRMASGVLFSGSFVKQTSDDNNVAIFGTKGSLSLSLHRFDGIEFTPAGRLSDTVVSRLRRAGNTISKLPQAVAVLNRGGSFLESYRAEWEHFIDSIERATAAECTLEDGRAALQVSLAAMKSVSNRKSVRIEDAPSVPALLDR